MTNPITCKNCGARNRLKTTSGGMTPVCGRCGVPLLATASPQPTLTPAPSRLSNTQTLLVIGVFALALTGLAELFLMLLY